MVKLINNKQDRKKNPLAFCIKNHIDGAWWQVVKADANIDFEFGPAV